MTNPYAEGYLHTDVGRQYQGVVRWALTAGTELPARLAQLAQQAKSLFIELTEGGQQSFSNHFARMSYVAQAAGSDPKLTYYLHQFDREAARHLRGEEARLDAQATLLLGARALVDAIDAIIGLECPGDLAELLPPDYGAFKLQRHVVAEFKPQLRALVLEDQTERKTLRVRLVADPGLDHVVHYDREGYNREFVGGAARLIRQHFELPVEVNLLAVEVDADGELTPGHLIVDPDFLVDITAVSNCFDATGAEPVKYLLGRVTPFSSSVALMAGNVANHFLDTAVAGHAGEFLDRFGETFAQYPLQYARLADEDVRALVEKCRGHYEVIESCVREHLPAQSIDPREVAVEPSFYAERYGLQGRLDLFLPPSEGREAAIVELKSGRIWRPNQHQVVHSHYVQTLLYDLLVKSVFSERTRPRNFVLYSGDRERPLRYAPPNKSEQYRALAVRNQIMAIELLLARSRAGEPCPLDWLTPNRYPAAAGFVKRDLDAWHAAYRGLDELERDYLRSFVGFVAREQRLAKVGTQSVERISGQSALWREDLETKLDGYAILHDLELQAIAQKEGFPVLTMLRPGGRDPDRAATLTSFRRGDIVVLYAGDARRRAVLHHQVYKGTITLIDDARVDIRLRATQPDLTQFERYDRWNVEGDLFDSSFTRLYRNLTEFISAPRADRQRVLGLAPPARPEPRGVRAPTSLTREQARIFGEIVAARDYYLLWGPPGTGKTSQMLKHLADHFDRHTRERVLILAFTNRAVDEICGALAEIGGGLEHRYVRIGSAHGCSPRFTRQLLQRRIAHLRRRGEIRELLAAQRIVVGTVSSVLGRAEALFELVDFDRLVVDEASQLLEPQLVNLMARFRKTVLIGDHRQLPAVVTQPEASTVVEHPPLRAIGLTDMRNSLFERLYARCQAEDWDWAYGQLTRQGRMHANIAEYANEAFYSGSLRCLGREEATRDWQLLPHGYSPEPSDCTDLERLFCRQSFVFVDTPVDLSDKAFRTNAHEAECVADAIRSLIRIKALGKHTLAPEEVGIITPYRAQIARLKATLAASELPAGWSEVTVDTVERFQGGSYRIVLLSLCANHPTTVQRLSSTSAEGIDRKLNVALTRARERVIAFGNYELLTQHNPAYAHFIAHCESCGGLWRGGGQGYAAIGAGLNEVGSSVAEFDEASFGDVAI